MFNETDIQIGDWLHFEYTNPIDGFVSFNFKVSQLRRDYGDELIVWGEKTPDGKHFGNIGEISRIQPIPLTDEILEKNGFSGEGYNMGIVGFSVEPIPDEKDGYEVFIWKDMCLQIKHGFTHFKKYIKYVHQLQHALRLCGIEKEIML